MPAVATSAAVGFTDDDVVILATKGQDAAAALDELRRAAPTATPVVCATNGVEVERIALRSFPNVYGINVMMPTAYLEPGVVQVISAPIVGGLDIGRYPTGSDAVAEAIAAALTASAFSSDACSAIMRLKYRKLVMNTANSIEAACGTRSDAGKELVRRAEAEAEAVYAAAGIAVADPEEEAPKRALMNYRPIAGKHRGGGSTWQSVARGGSVETDFLNGEIVLLGRLHLVATPVNTLMQRVLFELAGSGATPGGMDAAALLAQVSMEVSMQG